MIALEIFKQMGLVAIAVFEHRVLNVKVRFADNLLPKILIANYVGKLIGRNADCAEKQPFKMSRRNGGIVRQTLQADSAFSLDHSVNCIHNIRVLPAFMQMSKQVILCGFDSLLYCYAVDQCGFQFSFEGFEIAVRIGMHVQYIRHILIGEKNNRPGVETDGKHAVAARRLWRRGEKALILDATKSIMDAAPCKIGLKDNIHASVRNHKACTRLFRSGLSDVSICSPKATDVGRKGVAGGNLYIGFAFRKWRCRNGMV